MNRISFNPDLPLRDDGVRKWVGRLFAIREFSRGKDGVAFKGDDALDC